jgi:DNA-binding IclR family transcriptional regulator
VNSNHHKLLLKAISLLEEISDQSNQISIPSLARHLDLSYASAYRIVHTFLHCDWLHQTADGSLIVSPNLPGRLDRDSKLKRLVDRAAPIIDELTLKTGLSAKLTVRQENDAVSLYKKISQTPTSISTVVGTSFHLAGGSSGAVLLSGLPEPEIELILRSALPRYWEQQNKRDVFQRIEEVRETGVCFDRGQFHPDLHTASTPLRDRHSRIIAAVTIMGFPSDFTPENCNQFRDLLLKAGEEFSFISRKKAIEARRLPMAS